jgi:hypothetical protein
MKTRELIKRVLIVAPYIFKIGYQFLTRDQILFSEKDQHFHSRVRALFRRIKLFGYHLFYEIKRNLSQQIRGIWVIKTI